MVFLVQAPLESLDAFFSPPDGAGYLFSPAKMIALFGSLTKSCLMSGRRVLCVGSDQDLEGTKSRGVNVM